MEGGQYNTMNGEIPSVPITTLAGIASVTDLLPELPVPGPSTLGPPTASQNLLYHSSLVQEANQYLQSPNDALAARLSEALANTSTDNIELTAKNATAAGQSTALHQTSVLATVLARNNPSIFHNQMQWAALNSHYPPLNNGGYVNADQTVSGYSNSSNVTCTSSSSSANAHYSGANSQSVVSVQPEVKEEPKPETKPETGNGQFTEASYPPPGIKLPNNVKMNLTDFKLKPTIKLNKMTKEEQDELMNKGIKAFAMSNPKRAEEMGVSKTAMVIPRLRKTNHSAKNQNSEGEDTEEDSDEDEQTNKTSRKFFIATEKEREEEKRKQKDEKRKRKLDDIEYVCAGDEKRRRRESPTRATSPEVFIPKKVTKKVERKLIPMIPKIDVEELMESNTFQRFNKTVELIFDNMEEVNMEELNNDNPEEGADIPPEILIPKYQLQDLANETAKLKSIGAMESIPKDKIAKLLSILELNIRDGSKVTPLASDEDEDEDSDKLWQELAMERVMRAADSSLTVLHILTSKGMSKNVYLEDVIDRAALFIRFQLSNTIYPSYDPVYKEMSKSKTGYVGSMKKKRSYVHQVRDKNILALYNKVTEMTSLFAELVRIQLLTDTTVLHISTLGVAPFFVENVPELQLSALKLVTNVFSKYEKHRKLLLDDILASIARLPSSKRSLRTYRLTANSCIQMLTALVLQLIQCVVVLPRKLALAGTVAEKSKQEVIDLEAAGSTPEMDKDVLINDKYSMAMATAHQFLTVFLKKCGSKNEDIDYRPLFENFVQDLLTTVNTPEWPAAELLLSLLGHVLREKFKDRGTEMALRNSSLEYLGVVAARLRRDVVQSKNKVDYIDSIIKLVREEEEKESGESSSAAPSKSSKKKSGSLELDPEEERTRFLQRVLLDYLAVNGGETDHATMNARHFYICQWYRDANAVTQKPRKMKKSSSQHNNNNKKKKRRKGGTDTSDESSESEEEEEEEEELDEKNMSDSKKAELFRIREERKNFLVSKIPPFGIDRGQRAQVLSTHIDHDSAHLIVKYLSSKRPFFNSFNSYLQDILNVLNEQSTQVRTKALKCMSLIVAEDPEVLLRQDMQTGVQYSFMDSSTMVREAAVDLLGKFILHNEDLITQYYKIITDRILDTGVSVRKRVIKILKDICLGYPTYKKIPEICVKMIRRINDEEGIRKLVMEVFQNMWFIPIRERNRTPDDTELLLTRARNITDVVVACRDSGLEWFEQLLQTLFKPKEDKEDATIKNTEPPPQLVLACQQIVDCLVESVLRMEESNFDMTNGGQEAGGDQTQNNRTLGSNNRIVACLTTLFLFAKIRPQFLVKHVQTLQPYLSVVCKTQGDYQIISDVARTLELVVPLIKHPSEIFLAQLEEDAIKLILQHDRKVVSACVSCLGSVVNEVTRNYKLVRDCFLKYFGHMVQYRSVYENNESDPRLVQATPKFRRALFTVGLLLKHFDFSKKDLFEGLPGGADTVEEVFETTLFFILHESRDIQLDTLNSLGFICIRHHVFMLESKLKQLYLDILTEDFYQVYHKIKVELNAEASETLFSEVSLKQKKLVRVLNNIEQFLIEEEIRMIKQDQHWREYGNKENLKEMGDVSSGMASTVIQVYLKAILESFINPDLVARHAAIKVISLILAQGLVHPVQIVPYLICVATDAEQKLSHTADRELQEIEKKYPGFIHMKLLQGIRLSFRLQQIVQKNSQIVRGFRQKEGELPSALNGFLYSIMKSTKTQRRAILTSLLKQFDDTAKSSLSMMLYLADNLAYIPYTVVDEPLFVIHQIDIMISVAGSNLLQTFKESLLPPPSCEQRMNLETGKCEYIYDEDLDDDFDSVYSRLPEDCAPLQQAITASQGCMLLLVLKEHLKDLYGLNATKISQYSPTDNNKANERQVNRRANVKFDPKATIDILSLGDPPEILSDEQKKDLVHKYLEFKELMNKIDPDDEDDEEAGAVGGADSNTTSPVKAQAPPKPQNPTTPAKAPERTNRRNTDNDDYVPSGPGRHEPARSSHQPHQQAYVKYQQQHTQQIQKLQEQNMRTSSRPQRAAAQQVSKPSPVKASNNASGKNLVLDPSTGEMIPASEDEEDEDYEDEGEDDDDVQVLPQQPSKAVLINLGQLKHSSSSSSSKNNLQVSSRANRSSDGDRHHHSRSSRTSSSHHHHHHSKSKKSSSSSRR